MADTTKTVDRAKEAVVEAIEGAREGLDEGLGRARERFEELADEVGDKVQGVSQTVKRRAEAARTYSKERVDQAKESLRHGYERVRKDVGELSTDVNEYVRDNPGKSVLIAAAAGFLLGLLLRPRRDD